MKASCLFLCLTLGSAAYASELLWNNFDTAATGSVANLAGWTRPAWLPGTLTAQVSAAQAYSPSNSLDFPWHATGSTAACTNFNSIYNPTNEHPVIRCSAKLFTANSNAYCLFGLRNSGTGALLSFAATNGYGTFGAETHDAVFVPLVTGRYTDVTFFYNRSNNYYRLDYDYTNRVPWTTNNSGTGIVHTQFNEFVAARLNGTATNTGDFRLDNVRVETFPPHVWAWWRCDDTGPAFVEQLGTFLPTQKNEWTNIVRTGSSDPVFDGQGDFHNEAAMRRLYVPPAACVRPVAPVTNWTVEVAFRMEPGQPNVCFVDWGKRVGFDTNGAWLAFGYVQSLQTFYCNLRDAEQADSNYEQTYLGAFSPNGRWHHVALVKVSSVLSVYLDYQQITNVTLTTGNADGTYAFDTLSRAAIGQALNNGNACGEQTLIDEVRVSGRDLTRAEFLQPGQPLFVDILNSALENPWQVAIKGILGRTYRLEASPVSGPGAAWSPVATATVASTFTSFDVPSAAGTNFLRVLRLD